MSVIIIILVFVLVIAVYSYNTLQKLSQNVKQRASNVQVAISKKLSLINQLIDVVRNYQESEQFTQLTIAQESNATALMASYQQSGTVLSTIQGVAERFPNLKASDQYKVLMGEISGCEKNIQVNREVYNEGVNAYNKQRSGIPVVFMAQIIGFSEAPYLQFDISGNDATSLKEFKTDDGERLKQLFRSAGSNISGAAKSLAGHAEGMGKLISAKINSKPDALYYYMLPGGVPKGPKPLSDIKGMIEAGTLTKEIKIAPNGSDDWEDITTIVENTSQANDNQDL